MIRFDDIYGHGKVKEQLQTAVSSGQVRHAYLFEGMRGVGRMSCALAFASALVCEKPRGAEACGECKSCMMSAAQSHPDIRVITNQLYDDSKKSTNLSVDTIREMRKEIYIRPYLAERKVYIIPMAHTMTAAAQNSLLKVLEEPPLYCTIIMIAENTNTFLPTVLSRVVRLRFNPLPYSVVEQALGSYCSESGQELSADTIRVKARMGGGSIGAARELLFDSDLEQLRGETVDKALSLLDRRRSSIYEFSSFLKRNRASIKQILEILQVWFHDVMLVKYGVRNDEIVNIDRRKDLDTFCAGISPRTAAGLLDITSVYAGYINKNANYPIAAQCMAMEYWGEINDRNYRNSL